MQPINTAPERWHLGNWPFLAWVETVIKSAALLVGIYALAVSTAAGNIFALPKGVRLIQFILHGLLTLGLIAAIFDRIRGREIVSMVFVIFNNLGHMGIWLALMKSDFSSSLLTLFWLLMLAGDLVKIVFLKKHQFTVRGAPPALMFGLTSFYLVGYLILIVLQFIG